MEKNEEFKIPWYVKLMMKFTPNLFGRFSSGKYSVDYKDVKRAYKLFGDKKIHIEPLGSGSRGFIIYLDNKLSLWFYQDGKNFVFDGYEMGEYEDGEVTVLDEKIV